MRNQKLSRACFESLEHRCLLSAVLQIRISDGDSFNSGSALAPAGSPRQIDFGTLAIGSAARKVVELKNTGDSPLTITSIHRPHTGGNSNSHFQFAGVPGNQFPAPDTNPGDPIVASNIVLAPGGGKHYFKIVFPTTGPVQFVDNTSEFSRNFIEITSNASGSPYQFFVNGTVVKTSVAKANFATFNSQNKFSDSGVITAFRFQDGEPDRVVQTDDAANFFHLDGDSEVSLTLGGSTAASSSSVCDITYVLARDLGNVKQLELNDLKGGTVYKLEDIRGGTTITVVRPLAAGDWILYTAVGKIPPSPSAPFALNYGLTVHRQLIQRPEISVDGVSNASLKDFGNMTGSPQLSLTVRNTGGGTLHASASVDPLDVFEILNNISPDGVESQKTDAITLGFKTGQATPGVKTSKITIHSSDSAVADFSFDLKVTITLPNIKRRYTGTFSDGTGTNATFSLVIRKQQARDDYAALRGSLDVSGAGIGNLHAEMTYGKLRGSNLRVNITLEGAGFKFIINGKANASGRQIKGEFISTGAFAKSGPLLLDKFVAGRAFTRALRLPFGERQIGSVDERSVDDLIGLGLATL